MISQNQITSFSKAGRQIDQIYNKNCSNVETPLYNPRKPMRLIKYKQQFSPQFLSPGRQKLSSFLLFYSKYNASKNDYNKNFNVIDKNQKSFTVPKHNFQRMIQYSRAKRFFKKGLKSINVCDSNIFLNSRLQQLKTDLKNNKNLLRHFQFAKMESHDRKFRSYYDWNKFDKSEKQISSTKSWMCNKSFKQIKKPKKQHNRAHQFKSYTERKFLQLPLVTSFHQEENTYCFDMLKVNFQKIKKNWSGHAFIQFDKYIPKIKVRNDRVDPVWSMMNQYIPNFKSIQSKVKYPVFQKILNRKNEYPFRLSMEMFPRQILLRQKKMLN